MWTLFEPIHAIWYFTPHARAAFEAVNLRGFWRGYFAGRAAPLGPVGAAPVIAAFANFAPSMVTRALPDVWTRATPADALAAREACAIAALTETLDGADPAGLAEAADLLEAALAGLDCTGRVLGAANAALPAADGPLPRIWRAATILREHRGDGHIAALVCYDLAGCDIVAWRCSLDMAREQVQPARGWTDDDWDAALGRLAARGWVDANGVATEAARDAYREIEAITDRAAAGPWQVLGEAGTARLRDLITPLATASRARIPASTPIGLPPA
jgi:hypothetical protein